MTTFVSQQMTTAAAHTRASLAIAAQYRDQPLISTFISA